MVLCGSGVAGTIWPILAATYIQSSGWRLAYPALALTWAVFMLPLVWFLIADKPAAASPSQTPPHAKIGFGTLLKSRTFVALAIAGFAVFAADAWPHLCTWRRSSSQSGFGLREAAGLAGIRRDFRNCRPLEHRLHARSLSLARGQRLCLLLPVLVSLLLWNCAGSVLIASCAIAVLGFVSGADGDIVAYLISRNFDREVFASVYAPMVALFSLSSSFGPLLAGLCFDLSGNYNMYLLVIVPIAALAAILVGSIPSQAREPRHNAQSVAETP